MSNNQRFGMAYMGAIFGTFAIMWVSGHGAPSLEHGAEALCCFSAILLTICALAPWEREP